MRFMSLLSKREKNYIWFLNLMTKKGPFIYYSFEWNPTKGIFFFSIMKNK
jgi:hypothetical protein